MSDIPPDISHDQHAVRLKKLQDLRAAGADPFRANATQTHFSGEALKAYVDGQDYTVPVKVAGRLVVQAQNAGTTNWLNVPCSQDVQNSAERYGQFGGNYTWSS